MKINNSANLFKISYLENCGTNKKLIRAFLKSLYISEQYAWNLFYSTKQKVFIYIFCYNITPNIWETDVEILGEYICWFV